jgi:hypothetical protein
MSVKVFFVMAPPQPVEPDPEWEAEHMVFVKDGFALMALLVPVLWLFWHRMWLPLLAYLAYMVALSAVELSFGNLVSGIIATGCAILFALEANNLRRWSLGAKGWRTVGEAVGRNRDEAEYMFFRDWAGPAASPQIPGEGKPAVAALKPTAAQAARKPAARKPDDEPEVFGLFPEPDH